jgi:hypothetical protein
MFIQQKELPRLDMNNQGKLAKFRLCPALGASAEGILLVRIQKKTMPFVQVARFSVFCDFFGHVIPV